MIRNLLLTIGTAALSIVPLQALSGQNQNPDPLAEALTAAARDHQSRLDFDGVRFSGPGWEQLLEEGEKAQFFLLGEEHGIAENPKLAAALFQALRHAGYSKLVIEISPTMARKLDEAILTGGMAGLRNLYARPGGEPAFFGMSEEAEMLVSIRNAVPAGQPAFWGVDYEVLGDRQLIAELEAMEKPPAASAAVSHLAAAAAASWQKHAETGNPAFIFSFSGDPALVRAVRNAWPERDERASLILNTLEETLEINALFVGGRNWGSNARRAALIRRSFLALWNAALSDGPPPNVMIKMGASHLVRGSSNTEAFDLGPLVHELAEIRGTRVFSLLVLPGKDALTAVFDPVKLVYTPSPPKDGYADDLAPLVAAAAPDAFTLIDLRPLRDLRGLTRASTNRNLLKAIMGYDMLLVMSGSSASQSLDP